MNSEPLANLARIGLLDPVPFSAVLLQKMLHVAQSRLEDAMRQDNSMETRFDCAYTAIRAVADAALLRRGYRTSTSKPGHHQTTLQCLVQVKAGTWQYFSGNEYFEHQWPCDLHGARESRGAPHRQQIAGDRTVQGGRGGQG